MESGRIPYGVLSTGEIREQVDVRKDTHYREKDLKPSFRHLDLIIRDGDGKARKGRQCIPRRCLLFIWKEGGKNGCREARGRDRLKKGWWGEVTSETLWGPDYLLW